MQGSPALIYGQRDKLRADGPFLQLLDEFRTTLWGAGRLLVVGYGFRDPHINILLERWLSIDKQRQLLSIDPLFKDDEIAYGSFLRKLWDRLGPGRRPADVREEGSRAPVPGPKAPKQFHVSGLRAKDAFALLSEGGMDTLFDGFGWGETS
jgi:hypothetical protein